MNCEKWEEKLNRGLFGLAKPRFGSYSTLGISKIDSTVTRKKTRDRTSFAAEISSDQTDFDHSKYLTIEKTRFYSLDLASDTQTSRAVFAIQSVSHEKRQTFLGKLMSKNDAGKNAVLDYNRDVPGTIYSGNSGTWSFFIDNFTNGGRATEYGATYASISGGYLKNDRDSIYIRITSSFAADIVLIGRSNEHLAALAYKQRRPAIWMRKDLDDSTRLALASLLAVILSIKDYGTAYYILSRPFTHCLEWMLAKFSGECSNYNQENGKPQSLKSNTDCLYFEWPTQ